MAGRTKSDYLTDRSLELINQDIKGVKRVQTALQTQINTMAGQMNGPGLTEAAPGNPFRVTEETDGLTFKETISLRIPKTCYRVKVRLITVNQNTLKPGETTAQAIIRAKAHVKSFTVKCDDQDRNIGALLAQIGDFVKRKDVTKNRYQLVQLEALDIARNSVFNPMADPFNTFPFPVIDQGGGAQYFEIGSGITSGPSAPGSQFIVYNQANLQTAAIDATVRLRLGAATTTDAQNNVIIDLTKSFSDQEISHVEAVLTPFAQQLPSVGEVGPLRIPGYIDDLSQPYIDLEVSASLAARYKWVKNIYYHTADHLPVLPVSTVSFYFGGNPPTTGIPELGAGPTPVDTTAFTITPFQQDNGHTLLQIQVKQNSITPVLCKTIKIYKQLPGDVRREMVHLRINLLNDENFFVPGATLIYTVEVHHKANKTGIIYGADIIGVNNTAAAPIKRSAVDGSANSTFAIAPTAPASNLCTGGPDSEPSSGSDAYEDFTIGASASDNTKTFGDTGADHLIVVLRKASGHGDDDPDATNNRRHEFAVEDPTQKTQVCRVRKLEMSHRYLWVKNFAVRSGINIESAKTNIPFQAGVMQQDLSGVGLVINNIVTKAKRHAQVIYAITQPATAAYLRAINLLESLDNGVTFTRIKHRVLKTKAEAQMPSSTFTDYFNVHVRPNVATQFKLELLAVGGAVKLSTPAYTYNGGSSEPPTAPPSQPSWADIITNQEQDDGSMVHAFVVFRCYAGVSRGLVVANGTGTNPAGSFCFNDGVIDAVTVILAHKNDAGNIEKYHLVFNVLDGTQCFIDVQIPSLALGKDYIWRCIANMRNGVALRGMHGDVAFTAGGYIGTAGLPQLSSVSLMLQQVFNAKGKASAHHSDIILNYTQGVTLPGTGHVTITQFSNVVSWSGNVSFPTSFLSQILPGSQITVAGSTKTVVMVNTDNQLIIQGQWGLNATDVSFTYTGQPIFLRAVLFEKSINGGAWVQAGAHIHLLLDSQYQQLGPHTITKPINHVKATNFNARATIIGVGDNASRPLRQVVMLSNPGLTADDPAFADNGAPIIPLPKQPFLRWTNKLLRVGFITPTGMANNMVTHAKTALLLYFQCNNLPGIGYCWDVVKKQTQGFPFSFGSPINALSLRAGTDLATPAGTVTIVAGSTAVVGSITTNFIGILVGAQITIAGQVGYVALVQDSHNLQVMDAWVASASNVTYQYNNIAAFLIDMGKQAVITLNNEVPSDAASALTEIDSDDTVVFDALRNGGGFLFGLFYVFNLYNNVLTGTQISSAGVSATLNAGPSNTTFTVVNPTYS